MAEMDEKDLAQHWAERTEAIRSRETAASYDSPRPAPDAALELQCHDSLFDKAPWTSTTGEKPNAARAGPLELQGHSL